MMPEELHSGQSLFWYRVFVIVVSLAIVQYVVGRISTKDSTREDVASSMVRENEARTWAWWVAVRSDNQQP
jgi:hypothetical protein